MFEMLGNQLFLVRNYARAAEMLEMALWKDPKNKAIRRKLIICYAQTGQVGKALDIFLSLIKEDVDYIINTDPVDDDCPCPELVYQLEAQQSQNQNSVDFHLISGMLWLYCDLTKSVQYFQLAHQLAPAEGKINSVLSILESRLRKSHSASGKIIRQNLQS